MRFYGLLTSSILFTGCFSGELKGLWGQEDSGSDEVNLWTPVFCKELSHESRIENSDGLSISVTQCSWNGNRQECTTENTAPDGSSTTSEDGYAIWNNDGYQVERLRQEETYDLTTINEWDCSGGWCKLLLAETTYDFPSLSDSMLMSTECSWTGNQQECTTRTTDIDDKTTYSEPTSTTWNDKGYQLEAYLNESYSLAYQWDCSAGWCKLVSSVLYHGTDEYHQTCVWDGLRQDCESTNTVEEDSAPSITSSLWNEHGYKVEGYRQTDSLEEEHVYEWNCD